MRVHESEGCICICVCLSPSSRASIGPRPNQRKSPQISVEWYLAVGHVGQRQQTRANQTVIYRGIAFLVFLAFLLLPRLPSGKKRADASTAPSPPPSPRSPTPVRAGLRQDRRCMYPDAAQTLPRPSQPMSTHVHPCQTRSHCFPPDNPETLIRKASIPFIAILGPLSA